VSFFDPLHTWELVMLVLGAALVVLLTILLVVLIVRDRPYVALLPFFVLGVAMIGWPSIQSLQFTKDGATINTITDALQKNPTDSSLRRKLSEASVRVAARPTKDPAMLTSIARAEFALGDHDAAASHLEQALKVSPALPQALELNKRIELDRDLTRLTTVVEQHPEDTAAKRSLETSVAAASNASLASPVALTNLARAQAAVGKRALAESTATKALLINRISVSRSRTRTPF
jgi:tetratricopeptide (TPR) repeat protein